MASSNKGNFEVYLYHPYKKYYYEMFNSPDKKCYIVGEKDKPFEVRIVQKNPRRTFASKMYIDGVQVNTFKTFKYNCTYFGFKNGYGYNEFLFTDSLKNEEEKSSIRNKEVGTIRIDFFDCERVVSKRKAKKNHQCQVFDTTPLKKDKEKFHDRPLSVVQGNYRELEFKNYDRLDGVLGYEYTPLDHEKVDSIVLYYSCFDALQTKKLISEDNPKHLKYLPDKFIQKKSNFAIVMKTILKVQTKIYHNEIEQVFEKFTKRKLNSLFSYKNLSDFLKEYILHFKIEDGYLVFSSPDEIKRLFAPLYSSNFSSTDDSSLGRSKGFIKKGEYKQDVEVIDLIDD